MNKQIEALKMAIKILSQDEGWFDPSEAIKACKEALASLESDALAEADKQEVREVMDLASYGQSISRIPAQPLDDDAISEILNKHGMDNVEQAGYHIDIVKLIRDVELAHGIE